MRRKFYQFIADLLYEVASDCSEKQFEAWYTTALTFNNYIVIYKEIYLH